MRSLQINWEAMKRWWRINEAWVELQRTLFHLLHIFLIAQ